MHKRTIIRLILIILAVALVVIPIMIVGITGQGFGELVSQILVSSSILCVITAIMLGADKQQKNKYFIKIGISIALLIVLRSLWI